MLGAVGMLFLVLWPRAMEPATRLTYTAGNSWYPAVAVDSPAAFTWPGVTIRRATARSTTKERGWRDDLVAGQTALLDPGDSYARPSSPTPAQSPRGLGRHDSLEEGIYYRKSTNAGATWSASTMITPSRRVVFTAMTVDSLAGSTWCGVTALPTTWRFLQKKHGRRATCRPTSA